MNTKFSTVLAAIFFSILTSLEATSTLPKGVRYIETVGEIEAYELESNGLRILIQQNKGLPVAAVMITYEVGGRNEVAGTTGMTHILEHMMFKGTDENHEENGYSQSMERIGARFNATTYYDRTNYYAVLPREHIDKALALEADRMRNLRITDEALQAELTVVFNEYDRKENSPTQTLFKEICGVAFKAHPYGQPVIGWKSDIENTSPEKLRRFYDTFYWPENATLTILGDFDKKATLATIKKYYASIPNASQPIPLVKTIEPEQLGPRRTIIKRAGKVGAVAIGYKVPEGIHRDWAALQLISQILGANKTGRFYSALDDKGKASSTFAFAPQLRDPSLFFLGAFLTTESTHEEVERIILDTIDHLSRFRITDKELDRAKSAIAARTVYNRDGLYNIAQEINEYIAMGDWTGYIRQPQAIQTVTVEDIQRVAKTYLTKKNSTTGWYIPTTPEKTASSFSKLKPSFFRDPEIPLPVMELRPEKNPRIPFSKNSKNVQHTKTIQQAKIGDIEVVVIDLPVDNVVSFIGSFAAGESFNPKGRPVLAGLTASMLDKGTQRQNRFIIAEQLDTLGASIAFDTDAHSLLFSGKFLRKNAGNVMNLLAEQIRQPAFDPEVLESLKARKKAYLLKAINNPEFRASNEASRLLYPEGHPNYKFPIETLIADLENTTIEDIHAFHQEHYGPKSMQLVFAGDVDFHQIMANVELAFASWKGGKTYLTETVFPLKTDAQSKHVALKDKPSAFAYLAQFTGLQRNLEGYLHYMGFSIGNYILGGSFHSRLMSEVRERQGLTYHIASMHQGDLFTPGHWAVSSSFAPSMLEEGLKATKAVLEDWHEKGVSEKEVKAAKTTLRGSYLVNLSTTKAFAEQVHSFIRRDLTADFIDSYLWFLDQITTKDINLAIRKYFDPAKLILVTSGSLGATTQK